MYAALGRRLSEATDAQDALSVIRDLKAKLRDRVPTLKEVIALFPEIICTANVTKQRSLMKYILVGLTKPNASAFSVDYEAMTIEHLVSQSQIGTNGWTEAIVGQAGNLLLVTEDVNARLKNKPFKEKKRVLIGKNVTLPPEIETASSWTPDDVLKRTMQMATEAYDKVWRI